MNKVIPKQESMLPPSERPKTETTRTVRASGAGREEPERRRWDRYEEEKQKLQTKGLTPSQYEQAINEVLDRLGL